MGERRPGRRSIAPTDPTDFKNFAQAVAERYSGRHPGLPFVRFFGIWNESNLATFLRPQFDAAGRIVSPAIYARLAIAGYAGIKAANPQALVGVGETSSNGRNRRVAGLTDTVAPGTFMQLWRRRHRGCGSTPGRSIHTRSPSTSPDAS